MCVRHLAARDGTEANFVVVEGVEGLIGTWGPIGEREVLLVLGALRPALIGQRIDAAIDAVCAERQSRHGGGYWAIACAAVELALMDLKAKLANCPLYALFGTARRQSVPCYVSLLGFDISSADAPSSITAVASQYWGAKWALRRAPGALDDHELTAILRAIAGRGFRRVMIDALCSWDRPSAARFLAASERFGLTWLEEPLSPRDLAGYRSLSSASTPLAAGEHAYSVIELEALADTGVSVLQPDASWCGVSEFAHACTSAALWQRPILPHGAGLLPALHIAALHDARTIPAVEYHVTMEPRRQRFWRNTNAPNGGLLAVPQAPGIGLELSTTDAVSMRDLHCVSQMDNPS